MKKNNILTFIFACIPGAGQMYLGYMKLGTSTMGLFAFLWFISTTMQIGTLIFLLPVIWFFSFFDTLNKNGAGKMEDHYIFADQSKQMQSGTFRLMIAFLLILCGGSTLIHFLVQTFAFMFPWWQVGKILNDISNSASLVIIAAFILYIGITLITGKKMK